MQKECDLEILKKDSAIPEISGKRNSNPAVPEISGKRNSNPVIPDTIVTSSRKKSNPPIPDLTVVIPEIPRPILIEENKKEPNGKKISPNNKNPKSPPLDKKQTKKSTPRQKPNRSIIDKQPHNFLDDIIIDGKVNPRKVLQAVNKYKTENETKNFEGKITYFKCSINEKTLLFAKKDCRELYGTDDKYHYLGYLGLVPTQDEINTVLYQLINS